MHRGIAVDQAEINLSAHTTKSIETCMLRMTPDNKQRICTAPHIPTQA